MFPHAVTAVPSGPSTPSGPFRARTVLCLGCLTISSTVRGVPSNEEEGGRRRKEEEEVSSIHLLNTYLSLSLPPSLPLSLPLPFSQHVFSTTTNLIEPPLNNLLTHINNLLTKHVRGAPTSPTGTATMRRLWHRGGRQTCLIIGCLLKGVYRVCIGCLEVC